MSHAANEPDAAPAAADLAAPAFDVATFVGLGRVMALVPAPPTPANSATWAVAAVERLDQDGARQVVDLWRVSLAADAPPTRLTLGDTRDTAPAFGLDGSLYFLSDRTPPPGLPRDDDKRTQVWVLPAQGGEPYPVTDEPLGVADFRVAAGTLCLLTEVVPGTAHEAQRKAAADRKKHGPSLLRYTTMPVRFWDRWLGPGVPHLIAYDLTPGTISRSGPVAAARRDLTPDATDALRETSWDLSPDGQLVAIGWQTLNPTDRIFDRPIALLGTQSPLAGQPTTLVGAAPGAVATSPRFSPDGTRLAFARYVRTADAYAARTLWLADRSGDGAHAVTATWDRWPTPIDFTTDGLAVVVNAEDEGHHRAFRVDLATGAPTQIGPRAGSWDTLRVTGGLTGGPSGDRLVGVRSSILHAPEPFACDARPDADAVQLATLSGFDPRTADALAEASELRLEVAPSREVQAWYVRPKATAGNLNADSHSAPRAQSGPMPRTLFWIHGGPVHAWTDQWHWRWSPLVMAAQGYATVLPNPAGSTGFGAAWVNDIWGNVWGGRCYDDLMGLVDVLEARGTLSAANTAVMGGSFGGYMTNWIGGHTDRFRLLVAHASIFQMSAFGATTDVPAWWWLMMQSTPWSDGGYDRYAPSAHVQNWRTPTLVLHGERDYRVPVTEALALFEALQLHGVPSELAIFPDENHWIGRPNNVIAWYETVLDFLTRRWDLET